MSTIASLNINLGMNSAVFTAGIKKARSALKSFTDQIASLKGIIAGAAAAIGTGLMVNSIKNLTSASMESIDTNAKMADKLGIATEFLVGFQHAATLAGSSTESLNKGLGVMSRNLGLAAMGAEAQSNAFRMIGLDANALAQMKPEQAFMDIAEAIKNTENPYQRLASAQAIFGKGAGELLNTLMLGRQGLLANKKEAVALGLAYSRVDAAQVEAANDALTRVGASFAGLGNQLAIKLAPLIESVSTRFVAWATEGGRAARIVTSAMQGMAMGVGFVADMIQVVNTAWLGMKFVATGAFAGIMRGLFKLTEAFVWFAEQLGVEGLDISGADEWTQGLVDAADEAGDAFNRSLTGPSWSKRTEEFFQKMKDDALANAQVVADAADKGNLFGGAIPQLKEQKAAAAPKVKAIRPVEIKDPESIGRSVADSFLQKQKRENEAAERAAKLAAEQLAESKKQTGLLTDMRDAWEEDGGDSDDTAVAFF